MCGIVGYIGPKEACPILINGLKRLEYRGYDSAGVALLHEGNIEVYKCKGRVLDLENHLENHDTRAHLGMGHTRWATHGEPNDINAHPHTSTNGVFSIVHNGIIENHALLKEKLQARGYTFKSETDTEVLANLIEYIYLKGNIDAEMAVRLALAKVIGAYGLVVMCKNEPDKLIVARKGSPLVIGVGQGEYFVASDATPIVEYTKNVIYLNDDDVAILKRDEMILKTIKNTPVSLSIQQVDIDINKIEKGGFPHFMLKEIFEQVNSIYDTIRGRVNVDASEIYLGGISEIIPKMINARRIIIIGCGTSWHAGLVGEHMIESLARIPVEVEYASEFRYRNPKLMSLMGAVPLEHAEGYVAESQGSGIRSMIREMTSRSLGAPRFVAKPDNFKVILGRHGAELARNRTWLTRPVDRDLSLREETLLMLLREQGTSLTVGDMRRELGWDSDDIRLVCAGLLNDGLVETCGEDEFKVPPSLESDDEGDLHSGEALGERVLALLAVSGEASARDMANLLGVPISRIRYELPKLIEKNLILPTAGTYSKNRKYVLKR